MKRKVDGDAPPKWQKVIMAQRARAQAPPKSPWVSRALLRGLTGQADSFNFLHELIDLRWLAECSRKGVDPFVAAPDENLVCDVRQHLDRQGAVLLTSSLWYNYARDRILIPVETLHLHGWELPATDGISKKIAGWPFDNAGRALPPGKRAAKASPGSPQRSDNLVRDLAGNSMVLADLGLVLYAAALAMKGGPWVNPEIPVVFSAQGSVPSLDIPEKGAENDEEDLTEEDSAAADTDCECA